MCDGGLCDESVNVDVRVCPCVYRGDLGHYDGYIGLSLHAWLRLWCVMLKEKKIIIIKKQIRKRE